MKGEVSERLLENLSLEPTRERAYPAEAIFTGHTMRPGWFVLVINRCNHDFVRPKSLERLSELGEVIACSVEEHVMWSSAELWRGGAQIWSIQHDAQKGMLDLDASGFIPEAYSAIRNEYSERQEQEGGVEAEVDYIFDIPLLVAKSIVGFKHDEAGTDDEMFLVYRATELGDAAEIRKPRWRFW